MNANLEIRPYQPGDESAILQLFEEIFKKPMALDYWNWRFRDNPVIGPSISLAWDGERLAAHYAVSPVMMQISGESRLTALSMTTMTHPNYRGQGLFMRLASDIYVRLQRQGCVLVWGFPNGQSHRGFIRDLNWRNIGEIPMLQMDLNGLRSMPSDARGTVIELNNFDSRVDQLWSTICPNYKLSIQRNQKFMNWRYGLNPQNKYRILACCHGDELLGYVVFKSYGTDFDIVDILTIDDRLIGVDLVRGVIDLALEMGAMSLNMWEPLHSKFHLELEKLGFRNGSPVTYFGARVLNETGLSLDVADLRNWHFSMGDSDVF